jgi:hypothetical protein
MLLRASWALLAAVTLLASAGCGDPVADAVADSRARAEVSLGQASDSIRVRVTQTCSRWQDSRQQCDTDQVYGDVLDCWIEKGLPHLTAALEHGVRKRARERRVIMHHSLCMEKRGWRLVPGSGGYF